MKAAAPSPASLLLARYYPQVHRVGWPDHAHAMQSTKGGKKPPTPTQLPNKRVLFGLLSVRGFRSISALEKRRWVLTCASRPAQRVHAAALCRCRYVGSNSPASPSRSQSSTVTEPLRKVISPSPLRSCKVRFTCTVERPSAPPNSAWVSGNSYVLPWVSPTALRRTYSSHRRWAIRSYASRRPTLRIHSRNTAPSIRVSRQNASPIRGQRRTKSRTVSCGTNITLHADSELRLWSITSSWRL